MPKQNIKTTPIKKATLKEAATKIAAKAIKPADVKAIKSNVDEAFTRRLR